MSADSCKRCGVETPLNGYICEWCTMLEYQRIGRLPVGQWGDAKDVFDREKFGFVLPYKSPEEQLEESTKRLRDLGREMRALGVDVKLPDEDQP